MKILSKLALVSALAVSANAMAMEALEDDKLSSTTGQEGITLKIYSPGITIGKLFLHDNDGLDSGASINNAGQSISLGGTEQSGAIIVSDVKLQKAGGPLDQALATIRIDADGGNATDSSEATLNIGVDLSALTVSVGSIGIGKSGTSPDLAATGSVRRGALGSEHEILSNIKLSVGATKMNVQLGNQPQGALILADGQVSGGVRISGLTLTDNDGIPNPAVVYYGGAAPGTPGQLVVDDIKITSAGQDYLNAQAKINIDQNLGLAVTLSDSKTDVYAKGIHLGNALSPSIGDVELQGLDLGGTTLFVHGH